MYLRLENWSVPFFLSRLESNGLPHGNHIIKVYASETDPRLGEMYERDSIFVCEIKDDPFEANEIFTYEEREGCTGSQLNDYLQEIGLSDAVLRRIRALFRFASNSEIELTQRAMSLKNKEGGWLIDHPLGVVDGITKALHSLKEPEAAIHLDVFIPDSLARIAELLEVSNLDNENKLVSYDEVMAYKRRTKEG